MSPFQHHSIFGDFSIFFLLLQSYSNLIVNHALQSKLMYSMPDVYDLIYFYEQVLPCYKPGVFSYRRSQTKFGSHTSDIVEISVLGRVFNFLWMDTEKKVSGEVGTCSLMGKFQFIAAILNPPNLMLNVTVGRHCVIN